MQNKRLTEVFFIICSLINSCSQNYPVKYCRSVYESPLSVLRTSFPLMSISPLPALRPHFPHRGQGISHLLLSFFPLWGKYKMGLTLVFEPRFTRFKGLPGFNLLIMLIPLIMVQNFYLFILHHFPPSAFSFLSYFTVRTRWQHGIQGWSPCQTGRFRCVTPNGSFPGIVVPAASLWSPLPSASPLNVRIGRDLSLH